MKRSVYWREELAADFQDIEFRKEYFLSLIRAEKHTVVEALKRAIKAMGVKEFAHAIQKPPSNVSRTLSANDYKLSTLNLYLKVFGLELSVEQLAS